MELLPYKPPVSDHQSPATQRIFAWLGQVSPSGPSERPKLRADPQSPFATPLPALPQSHKRRQPLAEVNMNVATPPRKKARMMAEDETPRASGLAAMPRLSQAPDQEAASLSTSNSRSDASSVSRRSRSPEKRMAALRLAEYGVVEKLLGNANALPGPLQPLVRSMKSIAAARGIIPPDQSDELLPYIADDDEEASSGQLVSAARVELGGSPTLDFAAQLVEDVSLNISLARSEAAWNGNVHTPLFVQAWRASPYRSSTRWENITTASIEPTSLLPTRTPSQNFASKKADFALVLSLGIDIERRLSQAGIVTLTQTMYEPLRFSPLTVAFETKTSGESWAMAKLQLNTWTLAGIAKLRELLAKVGNSSVEIPALPLVVVQGGEWKFLYLEVGSASAQLWSSVTIGESISVRGVFQVVAALQRLIAWSETVYRPWFVGNILTPLLDSMPEV